MKITYDPQVDVLSILFKNTSAQRSEQKKADTSFEYDKDGDIVAINVFNASQITNPLAVEYSVSLSASGSSTPTLPSNDSVPTTKLESSEEVDSVSLKQRQAFFKLPIEERRRILEKQATEMVNYYQQNLEWKEFLAGDIVDI